MDAYENKFKKLQEFIPFLNKMIQKIGQSGDKEKEPQVMKMRSLKEILINPDKKVRFETLVKCEEVLIKLYEKVEGTKYNGTLSASYQTDINKVFNQPKKVIINPTPENTVDRLKNREGLQHENLSDYLQAVHDKQHSKQGGSVGRPNDFAALRSRLGGVAAGLGRGGANRSNQAREEPLNPKRPSILGQPPHEKDQPAGGLQQPPANRFGDGAFRRGGGGGAFGRGGFNRRGSQDSDEGLKRKGFDRIPSLNEGAPVGRGGGAPLGRGVEAPLGRGVGAPVGGSQRIPGLGSDTEDSSPGTSSKPVSRYDHQSYPPRRGSTDSKRSDGRISPWEDPNVPAQGVDRSWLQDTPRIHRDNPENVTFWQNRVGPEDDAQLKLNKQSTHRQNSQDSHHRPRHSSPSKGDKTSPSRRHHHSQHRDADSKYDSRRDSFDREYIGSNRDISDKGSSRERDRHSSSRDRDKYSHGSRRPHEDREGHSSHHNRDRRHSGDKSSHPRRSNEPMSPNFEDQGKQDAPRSIPLDREKKDPRQSPSSLNRRRRSSEKSSSSVDRTEERSQSSHSNSSKDRTSNQSSNNTNEDKASSDLPNPVPTVRQDPRRRDPRQRPPPVNVVKPINTNNAPGNTPTNQFPSKSLPLPAGASLPPHMAANYGGHHQQQHPRHPNHQFPPRPGFGPPQHLQQRPRFPPNNMQQRFPNDGGYPPRPFNLHQQQAMHPIPGQPFNNHQRMQRPDLINAPIDSLQQQQQGIRNDPRMNNRPTAGGANQQPRNYREFRIMKEEQEKKRREAEERHRQEMQKYEKPEKPIEIKSSEDNLKKDEDSKDKKVDADSKKDSSSPATKSSKESKKISSADETKAIEQMKKSFKIPKLKKKETVEDSSKDEKGKLKTFDMFSTDTKSVNKEKKDPRRRKDSDKELPEVKVSEKSRTVLSRLNSDSDSDQGLTIAEDLDESGEKSKDEENPKESILAGNESNEKSKEEKPDLKELLKNIVSTLEPTEATKLLEKAQNFEKLGNLTLDEFKEFLFSKDSDTPQENKSKGPASAKKAISKSKAKPKAVVKKQPANSRRSGRNRKAVIEDTLTKEADNEDESETETFVIEPKDVKKPKRGRKAKTKKQIIDSDSEEQDLKMDIPADPAQHQDDSKNEAIEENEASTLTIVIASTTTLAEEKKDVVPAKTRMANKQAAKPAMKSKTWFPGDNRGIVKRDTGGLTSPPPSHHKHDIITAELKDADPQVFFGKEHNIVDILNTDFYANDGTIEEAKANEIKKRFEAVSSMQQKLANIKINDEKNEDVEDVADKSNVEDEKLCSKIKLSRPKPDIQYPLLTKELSFKSPNVITNLQSNLINRLKDKLSLKEAADDTINDEACVDQAPNLFGVIKGIKKNNKPRLPPALIPLQGNQQRSLMLSKGKRMGMNSKHCLQYLKEVKSEKALESQLSDAGLGSLFRCMSYSCSFTSNDVQQFKDHIATHVEDKFGALRCSLCFGKASDPTKLIKHIISKHGFSSHQCSYCFVRTRDLLEVFIHQLIFHPDEEKKYLSVHSMKAQNRSKENEDPLYLSHDLECPTETCKFKCNNNSPNLLFNHMSSNACVSNCDDEMVDYLCPYCSFYNNTMIPVIVHQSLEHPDQELKVLIRETEILDPLMNSDSEPDSSSECSTDTEISHQDQDFHDEDIDSLELTENMNQSDAAAVALDTAATVLGDTTMETDADTDSKAANKNEIETEAEDDLGLAGTDLFKCGNPSCDHSAVNSSAFKDHLMVCECATQEIQYYSCAHCDKQFKHVPTLLEHLKAHAVKRYFCSMCDYKSSVLLWTKSHMKQHKVVNTKLVPLIHSKNNVDEDTFLVVPKNSVPRGLRPKTQKDVYGLEDIDKINQKPEICRGLLRCALCEFSSKVRRNLIKHLNLHKLKNKQLEEGTIQEICMAVIGPVNPPVVETNNSDDANYSRMKSLCADDEDGVNRAPMSEQELAQMPRLIAENLRYACGEKDCKYITIDDVMLQYHIQALHSNLKEYHCPHCSGKEVPFDELSFHLRCHGDLLFKCGCCQFYHWQKRTAEKHVAEVHPEKKLFVRNIRYEEEEGKSTMKKVKKKPAITPSKQEPITLRYEPFKCGICDVSTETRDAIVAHCVEVHEVSNQYKCAFCAFSASAKVNVEKHCGAAHARYSVTVLKVHHVDPTTTNSILAGTGQQDGDVGATRAPLWSRNMEGLKHIRGILYDEEQIIEEPSKATPRKIKKEKFEVSTQYKVKKESSDENSPLKQTPTKSVTGSQPGSLPGGVIIKKEPGVSAKDELVPVVPVKSPTPAARSPKLDLDFYPSQCRECQLDKKTVSGMKMHIRLMHLGQGKFQCKYCDFTGNLKKPIIGHLKNKHPDQMAGVLEGSESEHWDDNISISENYSQEYWKTEWNLPTLTERRAQQLKRSPDEFLPSQVPAKKVKIAAVSQSGDVSQKRGRKRKGVVPDESISLDASITIKEEPIDPTYYQVKKMSILEEDSDTKSSIESAMMPSSPQKPVIEKPAETSPFESAKTYICTYCPKRSQIEDRIQRHLQSAHPKQGVEYRELTRDQVVASITRDQTNYGNNAANSNASASKTSSSNAELEYKCFYCECVGNIIVVKEHALAGHPQDVFRVTKCQNKLVSGYLECQLCGHLSPGFEKSSQKAHFHEEHPLQNEVVCSKYKLKHKIGPEAFNGAQQTVKFDAGDLLGLEFSCPKSDENCSFTSKSIPQMNNHLRKHTRTFKCGHCGRTLPDSSEFHRHSALSHGDKIPDLVKDPEAEAEFEALKGVLEWGIQQQVEEKKSKIKSMLSRSAVVSRSVARKSTGAECRATATDRCRNVARKSTGGQARCWPETRLTEPYSFYKVPLPVLDRKAIKTKMAMGGMEIKLDVEKMCQLVNLDTKLVLKDCAKVSLDRDELDL